MEIQRFQYQMITCLIKLFCQVIHTIDGLIEDRLLFFYVKKKRCI